MALSRVKPLGLPSRLACKALPKFFATAAAIRVKQALPLPAPTTQPQLRTRRLPIVADNAQRAPAVDALSWLGKSVPKVSNSEPDIHAAKVDAPAYTQQIHGVSVPVLRTVSSNALTTFNGESLSDQGIDRSRGGDKIAVVLKFQLKSSNYATVVLRELMGVPQDASS